MHGYHEDGAIIDQLIGETSSKIKAVTRDTAVAARATL